MNTFYFSGTLGDAFVVYCKAYNYWKHTGKTIVLQRLSRHLDMDYVMRELFNLAPFVNYEIPSIYIERGKDIEKSLRNKVKNYINSSWSEKCIFTGGTDPVGFEMEPYPSFNLPTIKLEGDKFNIGIQLHSGKVKGNFKGLALYWLAAVRRWLPQEEFDVYLFGTGAGYNMKRVARLCERDSIQNYVGKTDFLEWVSYIKAMDFFITPEGFSAFFAMSQRVRSLVFYTDCQILGRVHPKWWRENIIMSAGQRSLCDRILNRICSYTIRRKRLLAPMNPEQAWSLIYGESAYK